MSGGTVGPAGGGGAEGGGSGASGASSGATGGASAPGAAPPSTQPAKPAPVSPFAGLPGKFDAALGRGLNNITRRALGPYQTAVVRIGFAFTWLFFLLRELPHRHELYGPDSPWGYDLAERLWADNQAFTVLSWSASPVWFELVYFFSIAACVGLLLGWRTRAMSVFYMIGVLSLQNRSVFMGDGGDNVIHLMAIYLVVTRCGQVWSLDARRRARQAERGRPAAGPAMAPELTGVVLWALCGLTLAVTTGGGLLGGWIWLICLWGLWLVYGLWWIVERHWPGEPRLVSDVIANVVHNTGLLIIMAQVCIIYATAGWYKIQGSRWQDGTAVYYPLNLEYFAPFPALSDVLSSNGTLVMLMSYGTVMIQVAFPFALLNRKVKNIFLAVMIGEHIGIAILMGLPFFSLAMIAMDLVFLPTVFLLWFGYRTRRATDPLRGPLGRLRGRLAPRSAAADGPGAPGAGAAPAGAGAHAVPRPREEPTGPVAEPTAPQEPDEGQQPDEGQEPREPHPSWVEGGR